MVGAAIARAALRTLSAEVDIRRGDFLHHHLRHMVRVLDVLERGKTAVEDKVQGRRDTIDAIRAEAAALVARRPAEIRDRASRPRPRRGWKIAAVAFVVGTIGGWSAAGQVEKVTKAVPMMVKARVLDCASEADRRVGCKLWFALSRGNRK